MRLQGILCNKDLPPPITNKHLWATKSMKWYCVSDNYITLAWRTSETENTCSRAYKSLAWTLRHLQLPQKTYSNYTISLCVHFQKEHFKLGNHPHFWTTPQLVMGTGNPWISKPGSNSKPDRKFSSGSATPRNRTAGLVCSSGHCGIAEPHLNVVQTAGTMCCFMSWV